MRIRKRKQAENLQNSDLWSKADQGEPEAQYEIGYLYAVGNGMPQDFPRAGEWYKKAAAQGYAKAQFNLGVLYYEGHGVPQDSAKAREWFEKAAAQGYATAQLNLGMLYDSGLGVPKDSLRAYMWFSVAAAHLSGDQQKLAADNRDRLAGDMTPEQIADALRLTPAVGPPILTPI